MGSSVKITISLPEDIAKFTDSLANESGKPRSQIIAEIIAERRARALHEVLAQGYREYARENLQFAREGIALAAEVWDDYDWDFGEEKAPPRTRDRAAQP